MPHFTLAVLTFIYNCKKCVWIQYSFYGNHFGSRAAGPVSHPNKAKTPIGTSKTHFFESPWYPEPVE